MSVHLQNCSRQYQLQHLQQYQDIPLTGATVNTTADTTKDGIAACGSDFLITRATPNSSQDYVSVMTSGNDCSSFSKVTVSLYVENTWKGTVSTTDSYKVFNFNTSGLDVGDKVRVVTTWNY